MSAVARGAIAIAAFALVAYYGALFMAQRRLLYPRPRGPALTRAVEGILHVQIAGADGPVHVWHAQSHAPNGSARPAIIFAHGNGERAEDWLDQFGDLQAAGLDVLIVEYPGYGIAEGAPTQTSITNAILAGYDWLRDQQGLRGERIVAYGRSLGGGAAAQLAARRPVAALILESSFTSVRAFAGRFLAPGFLVRDPFDTMAVLAQHHAPLLVLHGTRDAIAPVAHGQALAAAVPGATYVPLPCGHNDCPRPWPAVLAFLSRHGIVGDRHAAP
jgi:pimeloyl-ACP methyl ester carboxylesterase